MESVRLTQIQAWAHGYIYLLDATDAGYEVIDIESFEAELIEFLWYVSGLEVCFNDLDNDFSRLITNKPEGGGMNTEVLSVINKILEDCPDKLELHFNKVTVTEK